MLLILISDGAESHLSSFEQIDRIIEQSRNFRKPEVQNLRQNKGNEDYNNKFHETKIDTKRYFNSQNNAKYSQVRGNLGKYRSKTCEVQ